MNKNSNIAKMKTKMKSSFFILHSSLFILLLSIFASCVDNDEGNENYYSSTKLTAAEFLEQRPELFSDFTAILKRTPYYSLLTTYGTYSTAGLLKYTVFAPDNEGIQRYMQKTVTSQ